jgi:hypothetical protein
MAQTHVRGSSNSWQAVRMTGWSAAAGRVPGDERKRACGQGLGENPLTGGPTPNRWAVPASGAHLEVAHRQNRSGSGKFHGSRRVWLAGPAHEEKRVFIFPKHFPYNTEVNLILGKILRDLRTLWEFSWR